MTDTRWHALLDTARTNTDTHLRPTRVHGDTIPDPIEVPAITPGPIGPPVVVTLDLSEVL